VGKPQAEDNWILQWPAILRIEKPLDYSGGF
jgi:hypothetical protein